MQVTKNITLDLLETGSPVIIKAKQNDRNTRYIAAHLYVGRLDYQVPSGTEIAFRYKKPDGTAGFYDALPDNSPAITVSGNTVTVELVEQVLTVAGCVHCEINMYNAASEKLTTFTFEISVEESVLTDAEIISSDYYNVLTAEIAKALQAVTDATEQAENAAQSAQDAADSASMSKDWAAGQPVTYSGAPVSIAYAGAQRIASITAYGETPQGGTTEAPVALTGVDSVQVCGNNLLPMATEAKTIYGVTFTPNSDGSVTIKGTATGCSIMVIDGDFSLPAGTYTLNSNTQTTDVGLSISKDVGGTQNIATSSTTSKTFTLPDLIKHYVAYIVVRPNSVVNTTIYPMLNLGESPLPYETYQGNVTPLPIPRPLHKVGDVRDVCQTRVKSVYDKRVVLDGTEIWAEYTDENWQGAGYHVYRFYDADALYGQYIASNKYSSRMTASSFKGTLGVVSGGGAILFSVVEQKTVDDWKAYLAAQKKAGTPLIIYRQSTAYDGTNGLDVCLTEYQTGYIESYADESITTAWISSTGELSTGAEVAYVLSSPETYATDPVDFDNTAGPLTVMTGGEVEVRMTELVGTRSDVSNNTVAFTETAQDADIASGEKLSVLFGKIKKRFSAMLAAIADRYTKAEAEARFMPNPNLLDNSDFVRRVNQRGVSGTITTAGYFIDRWKLVSGSVTLSADGLQLAAGTVIAQILEYAAGTDVIASLGITSGTASAAYDNATKTYTITATTACTLIWAKLEKGSIATPYVPKGYGAELAECMRYFEIAKMGFTYSQLPSNYLCTTSFKVQKRTIPTVTVVAGSIKNLYESLIDTSVTTVSTTRDSIVSVALSQTVLNNQAITLTAVLSADL